ncbi:MAG: UDP-N-acetylmuramoyl-L-alanyl-D-glutamate--2,6-diaminopimelate ligase [Chlamydiales bacterium]
MKLKKLITNLPIEVYRGSKEVEITGMALHSKRVAPGYLFIAKQGTTDDGIKYIDEAVSSGAVAILTNYPDPFLKNVVQLIYSNGNSCEAQLAARFYGHPSQSLFTIGVTGTNGKTTISYLIQHLLERSGMIGTLEYLVGTHRFKAELTTPDVITTQKLLKEMLKQQLNTAILEVSSHGLAQGRVDEIDFDLAVFSNLTQDHLDYHRSMEEYAQEKGKLFSKLSEQKRAIVNLDSPWVETILEHCSAQLFTYGFSKNADLHAHDLLLKADGTDFSVTYRQESVRFHWQLIGQFNVLNALAAIAVCLVRGMDLKQLPSLLSTFTAVPGRLEKVENSKGFHIFVDFAHTPDALESVLCCLKEIDHRKIITVFGCGGDRDRTKRAVMGQIADRYSSFTLVTSDNPRTEDPLSICEEIVSGFTSSNYVIEVNRQKAIEQAIERATPEDLILIAGKGHEAYQLIMHQTLPFDDKQVVQTIVNQEPVA